MAALAILYCPTCGKSYQKGKAIKFCVHCAIKLENNAENSSLPASPALAPTSDGNGGLTCKNTAGVTLSLQAFKARKETARSSLFRPSKKAKRPEKDVTIRIGIFKYDEERGLLKPQWGKTLPLSVDRNSTYSTILDKALTKRKMHDRNFNRAFQEEEYRLLYPDGKEAVFLPGESHQFFNLQAYKEDLGSPYHRVMFFLCSVNDISSLEEGEQKTVEVEAESDYLMEVNPNRLDVDQAQAPSSNADEGPCNSQSWAMSDLDLQEKLHRADNDSTSTGQKSVSSELDTAGTSSQHGNLHYSTGSTAALLPRTGNNTIEIQCPVCYRGFPPASIATHADSCCEQKEFQYIEAMEEEEQVMAALTSALNNNDPVESISNNNQNDVSKKELLIGEIKHLAESLSQESVRINIRRQKILADYKKDRIKKKITPTTNVRIVFMGETAVDDGGPKREFFTEILAILKRKLFDEFGKPISSTMALSSGEFRLAGELMAMSILQGGPAPNIFSEEAFLYLMRKLKPEMCSGTNKTVAMKIHEATDDSELQETLQEDSSLEVLQKIGYIGVPVRETLASAAPIVQSICIMDQVGDILPQLQQIEEGLSSSGVLEAARHHTDLWKSVFQSGSSSFHLSAEEFLDYLAVDFSLSQVSKAKEIDTYKNFCDALDELDNKGFDHSLKMENFIQWATGSRQVPPLGFPRKITLTFVHGCKEDCKCRPSTSTCDLVIKMPVHINTEGDMKEMLTSAMKDSFGFGQV